MNAKDFYNETAFIYNSRHDNIYTRHLRDEEKRIIKKYAHRRIIDIGGGTGFHESWVNADASLEMLRLSKRRNVLADARALPFENMFDTALIMFSVLNITGVGIVSEARRVLKSGGTLIVSYATPRDKTFAPPWSKCKDSQKTIRIVGRKLRLNLFCDLMDDIERIGFRHVKTKNVFVFKRPIWNRSDKMSFATKILFLLDALPLMGRMKISVFKRVD